MRKIHFRSFEIPVHVGIHHVDEDGKILDILKVEIHVEIHGEQTLPYSVLGQTKFNVLMVS